MDSVTPLLNQLEIELRALSLWQEKSPAPSALRSGMPFAMDTLAPHQWLQWVFIPNMQQALIAGNVPRGFCLEPYFAEVWHDTPTFTALLTLIKRIDKECQ
jgi:uncharacterized protein YqcC (DUF446 family)